MFSKWALDMVCLHVCGATADSHCQQTQSEMLLRPHHPCQSDHTGHKSWWNLRVWEWSFLEAPSHIFLEDTAQTQGKMLLSKWPRQAFPSAETPACCIHSCPVYYSNKADLLVMYQFQHTGFLLTAILRLQNQSVAGSLSLHGIPFVALFLLDLTWGKCC